MVSQDFCHFLQLPGHCADVTLSAPERQQEVREGSQGKWYRISMVSDPHIELQPATLQHKQDLFAPEDKKTYTQQIDLCRETKDIAIDHDLSEITSISET